MSTKYIVNNILGQTIPEISATTIDTTTLYVNGVEITGNNGDLSIGNRWNIPSGDTVQINSNYQSFVYGDLTVSGELLLEENSKLVVLNGDILVSGGTISGSGETILVDLPTYDDLITSGSYSAGTLTFSNNKGSDVVINGLVNNVFSGLTVNGGLSATTISATTYQNLPLSGYGTGLTFNTANYNLTIDGGNGVLDTVSLSVLASDLTVTGGTYNPNTGIAVFTNNTGGTFNVTGFLTGLTDTYVSGSTYSNNTFTFTNTSGGSFNVNFNTVTGLTSTGTISSNTISATTISGVTFYGDGSNLTGISGGGGSFSGGTVTNPTNFTGGLSANTFSATTYQNLPTVIQVSCSDEITALITGTTTTFRMAYNMLVTEVRGSLTTAQTSGSTFTVDILKTGTTILSTLITINNNQKSSKASGTTQPVISTPILVDDDEISVRITQIGSGTARGLKVTIIGNRTS